MRIIKDIPVSVDPQDIKKALRMEGRKEWDDLVKEVAADAQGLIAARAVYKVCYIEEKRKDAIMVNGTCLRSRLLRKNAENAERVFPYVITIGEQLEEAARNCKDLLRQFCYETAGDMGLTQVHDYMAEQLRSTYALGEISSMEPGSLDDWPIEEQRPLFSLIGDVESAIGVRLNDHLIMVPRKSISGVCFQSEVPFQSCQLCPHKRCPSRRASYDEKLAREHGILE
jgi:hypothetical protein